MMAFEYFVTENGRLIRVDIRKRMLSVLTTENNSLPLWQPILCRDEGGSTFLGEHIFQITDPLFPDLERIHVISGMDSTTGYFTLKNNTRIDFLPQEQVANAIAGCNLPKDFNDRGELLRFLQNNTKAVCEMAAYISKKTSTAILHNQEVDLREALPLINRFVP